MYKGILISYVLILNVVWAEELPGPAYLEFTPPKPLKGGTLTLKCVLDDLGDPPAQFYTWTKGSHHHIEISTSTWTIQPITAKTQGTYSCQGVNSAGRGPIDTEYVDVSAPPAMLKGLSPYTRIILPAHAQAQAHNPVLSCRVECYNPTCTIEWLRNGNSIMTSEKYKIKETDLPADQNANEFESVVSTLTWTDDYDFDEIKENGANYTCLGATIYDQHRPQVRSSTQIIIQHKPKCKIILTNPDEEEKILKCVVIGEDSSSSNVKFYWTFDQMRLGEINQVYIQNSAENYGNYTCVAMGQNLIGGITEPCEFNFSENPQSYWIEILSGILGILALIVIAIFIYIYFRKNPRKSGYETP